MSKLSKIKDILFESNKKVFGDLVVSVSSENIVTLSDLSILQSFHISKINNIQVNQVYCNDSLEKREVIISLNTVGVRIDKIIMDKTQSILLLNYLNRLVNNHYKTKRTSVLIKYMFAFIIVLLGYLYVGTAINGISTERNIINGASTVMDTNKGELPAAPLPEDPLLKLIDTLAKPNEKLATLLKKGAATGDYSISLTVESGYTDDNPIYVFSDPNCPHCRDIEPVLENLSLMHPVVIFPVTAIGGSESARVAASTLCEQQQNRKSSWQNVIKGRDVEVNACQQGSLALQDNDKTYQYFKFIGTRLC